MPRIAAPSTDCSTKFQILSSDHLSRRSPLLSYTLPFTLSLDHISVFPLVSGLTSVRIYKIFMSVIPVLLQNFKLLNIPNFSNLFRVTSQIFLQKMFTWVNMWERQRSDRKRGWTYICLFGTPLWFIPSIIIQKLNANVYSIFRKKCISSNSSSSSSSSINSIIIISPKIKYPHLNCVFRSKSNYLIHTFYNY